MSAHHHNMPLRTALMLLAAVLLAGCIIQPKVTQHRAIECLQMSMVYKNLVRQTDGTVTLASRRDDDNRIQIVVMAHGPLARQTIGRFRVEPDGRIFQFMDQTQQWEWVTTCD